MQPISLTELKIVGAIYKRKMMTRPYMSKLRECFLIFYNSSAIVLVYPGGDKNIQIIILDNFFVKIFAKMSLQFSKYNKCKQIEQKNIRSLCISKFTGETFIEKRL